MSADLDREIDRVARSLLDAEPSASFGARVRASTDARRRPGPGVSSLIPAVVVAAALVLAVVLAPWPTTERPPHIVAGRDVPLPTPIAEVAAPHEVTEVPPRQAAFNREADRKPRRIVATASNAEPAAAGIDALAAPAPLSVDTLATLPPSSLPSIQPAPLRVTALDLQALEMPSDAARGVDR
jgi:hypothetical protein